MDNLNLELSPAALALVPVVGLFLQTLKKLVWVKAIIPYFPYVGMAVAFALIRLGGVTADNPVVASIAIGLMASKGYDLIKPKEG